MLVLQNNIDNHNYDTLIVDVIDFITTKLDFSGEVVVRLTDEEEIQELNHTYRHKEYPTNVLSFPNTAPKEIDDSLGDIVICLTVVQKEAEEQEKTVEHHLTHMLIHGVLHLLDYDHIKESDAKIMEDLEIDLLSQLRINNPYE